jgi:hypothetical protein
MSSASNTFSGIYTVTIYVAAPGTPLHTEDGAHATSMAGHLYYVIDNGIEERKSYGFSPAKSGSISGPGRIMIDDESTYIAPRDSYTIQITEDQYKRLQEFGDRPKEHGFNMHYNGPTNSCVDFTWAALNHAGLHYRVVTLGQDGRELYEHAVFPDHEGMPKPLQNIDQIKRIKAPFPDSEHNREHYNPLPDRTLLAEDHQRE